MSQSLRIKSFIAFLFLGHASVIQAEEPTSRENPDKLCEPLIGVDNFLKEKFPKTYQWDDDTIKNVVREAHATVDPFNLVTILDEEQPDLELYRKAVQKGDCSHFSQIWEIALKEVPAAFLKRLEGIKTPENFLEALKAYRASKGPAKSDDEIDFVEIYLGMGAVYQKQLESHSIKAEPEFIHNRTLQSLLEGLRPYAVEAEKEAARSAFVVDAFIQVLDPMNDFLTPDELQSLKKTTSNYQGLGIQIALAPGGILVDKVIEGGMAEREGKLKKGDIIAEAPKGTSLEGISLNEVVKRLMGPANSVIPVKVIRGGEKLEFEVTRGVIVPAKIRCQTDWAKNVNFCRLPSFYGRENGVQGVSDDLVDFLNANPNGVLVLDLRSNPGGSLDEAVKMTSVLSARSLQDEIEKRAKAIEEKVKENGFKDSKEVDEAIRMAVPPIVSLEIRDKIEYLPPKLPRKFKESSVPSKLIVLVDNFSASASEVLACNIKASASGLVVSDGSTKTSGKASFQTFQEGSLGGILKYTGGYYHTMDGFSPHFVGCKPDIVVPAIETPPHRSLPGSFEIRRLESPRYLDRSAETSALLERIKASVDAASLHFETYEKAEDQFIERIKKLAEDLSNN